jgi:capsule polysaccharide export protein KpsE/RkpR
MISKPELREPDHNGAEEPRFAELDDQFFQERLLSRVRLLWNKRQFVFRWGLAGLLAATLVAFLIPRRYESTAQLMPPDSQSSSSLAMMSALAGSSSGGGLGMLAGDLLGVKSTGALFVGVLRSRTVQDRIVDRFDLRKVYGESLQMKAREELADRTGIAEDRKSGIITIAVTDHDPKRAAAIAGAYVEELNTLIAQVSTSSARRERIFLEDRLAAVKVELEGAEKDFSQFASNKGAIDIPAQGKAMLEAAAMLEGQLIAARSELEGLRQIYSDKNVRVRSTQARVSELQQQLRRLGGSPSSATENADQSASDATYPSMRQLPILGVPFADKLRRTKVEEVVFETLTKQYELAKVQEAKEVPSVKILDAPQVPERKSFPPRLLITSLGTLVAVICATVWVFATVQWQETDNQHPAKVFAQEVYRTIAASIPVIARNGNGGQPLPPAAAPQEQDRPRAKDARAGN